VEASCKHGNEPSFVFRIMLENSWVAERLAASQEALSSVELVS
jgi:hypothetical protein